MSESEHEEQTTTQPTMPNVNLTASTLRTRGLYSSTLAGRVGLGYSAYGGLGGGLYPGALGYSGYGGYGAGLRGSALGYGGLGYGGVGYGGLGHSGLRYSSLAGLGLYRSSLVPRTHVTTTEEPKVEEHEEVTEIN